MAVGSNPNPMINKSPIAILVCSIALLSGCATIVKDDSQPVAFSSDPQGATVSINSVPRGVTPTTIMVRRSRKSQIVQYDMAGYKSQQFTLGKSVAGMTFGNIIFGGIIGVGVDIASGKATNYEDSVHVKMIPVEVAKEPEAIQKEETDIKPEPEVARMATDSDS